MKTKTENEKNEIVNAIARELENNSGGGDEGITGIVNDAPGLQVRARIQGIPGFDVVSYFVLPGGTIFVQYYKETPGDDFAFTQELAATLPGVSSVVPHFEKTTGRDVDGGEL
jgi:hypothetical protein